MGKWHKRFIRMEGAQNAKVTICKAYENAWKNFKWIQIMDAFNKPFHSKLE